MKLLSSSIACIAFALAGAAAASAQATPSPAPASPAPSKSAVPAASPSLAASPTPSPSPTPKTIQFSGFADAGYVSRIGNTTTKFTSGGNSRVFDTFDRQPNLQNLNVQAALNAGALGGKVELSMGTDADVIASYPAAFNGFDLTQAYLTYTAGKFTLQGGKFATLAGAEVIESPSDNNFSRSILFGFAVPFTHTGGRLTYAADPKLSLIAGVNLGWDVLHDTNSQRTAEYGVVLNPSPALSFTAQGYTGIEQISNVPLSSVQGQRTLVDIVGTFKATPMLTLVVNYDRGAQHNAPLVDGTGSLLSPAGTAVWNGFAGYATYQATPKLAATLRYEGFKDVNGYRTGFAQLWHEGTLTASYSMTPSITLRGEVRRDKSDRPVFAQTNGLGNTSTGTYGLELLVKY